MGTRLLTGILSLLLLATSFRCSDAESKPETSAFVSGKSECIDCEGKNVKPELAYQGLQVAIKCRTGSGGGYEVKSSGKLDRNGEFKVELPAELVGADGEMEDCFAQLHSVSNAPCPYKSELNPSKLVLKSKKEGVHTFSTSAVLPFSSATCASAFFWPHLPLPQWHPFYKPLPHFPPLTKPYSPPTYKPPVPIYKPPTPVPKPPAPAKKPRPPPVPAPVKKPCPPAVKPLPPPVPTVKPLPPPVPTVKPLPPPMPWPPLPKLPPIYHTPWPPMPKFPPIYHKPMPKLPPMFKNPYHDIPKFPPTHA